MAPVQGSDPRPLTGEPLALDLLNTRWLPSGTPVDLLATPAGTRAWLAAAGAPASPVPETTKALVLARETIRDVVSGQGGAAALDQLNAVLSHGHLRLSIGPPMNPRQTLEVDDPAWRPAVMAAANLLELLAQAPDRIRRCCSWTRAATAAAAGAPWKCAETALKHAGTMTVPGSQSLANG